MEGLQVSHGQATATGPKTRNEDSLGLALPVGEERLIKGLTAVIADGVSGCDAGDEASQLVVRGLLSDYYATPDTWETAFCLQKVIEALNRWLVAQAIRHSKTLITTLSALVLRGRRYAIAHIGDTRIYRRRGSEFVCLTRDHVWDQPGMQHVLTRAVGLDEALAVDFLDGEIQVGDVFLLVTDGVWEPVGDRRLHELLLLHDDPQRAADALVEAALHAHTQDNASAVVVRIDALPTPNGIGDHLDEARDLPIPERLKPGQLIDQLEVIEPLHTSRASLLYRVRHRDSGQVHVMKTLPLTFADDPDMRSALLTEEWLTRRLVDSAFPQVLPLGLGERHWLYFVISWHEGQTLAQRLEHGHRFAVSEVIDIGCQLARALGLVHRLYIVHRDIKLENLHWGKDGRLRILDFGVAACDGITDDSMHPGTPSYMAPELFANSRASNNTDLYAAGASLYRLLTRHYPYGEIEPFQSPRFGDPVPPSRYRPDIPEWLDKLLLKAVARDPLLRFETAEEMLLALERGAIDPVRIRVRSPTLQRAPEKVWKALFLLSLLLNFYLLLRHR